MTRATRPQVHRPAAVAAVVRNSRYAEFFTPCPTLIIDCCVRRSSVFNAGTQGLLLPHAKKKPTSDELFENGPSVRGPPPPPAAPLRATPRAPRRRPSGVSLFSWSMRPQRRRRPSAHRPHLRMQRDEQDMEGVQACWAGAKQTWGGGGKQAKWRGGGGDCRAYA